jgi:uncharacterized protein YycO
MTPKILLFRGRGLISALIRWQTRSCYSHAALLLPDGETIVEAWQGAGVRIKRKFRDWSNVDSFDVHMTTHQWGRVMDFAVSQIGKPYDYRQVIRFVTRTRSKPNDRWFCSELVAAAFNHAGMPLLHRIIPSNVSPALLALSPRMVWVCSGSKPKN